MHFPNCLLEKFQYCMWCACSTWLYIVLECVSLFLLLYTVILLRIVNRSVLLDYNKRIEYLIIVNIIPYNKHLDILSWKLLFLSKMVQTEFIPCDSRYIDIEWSAIRSESIMPMISPFIYLSSFIIHQIKPLLFKTVIHITQYDVCVMY